jgi:hypothetical protein
MSGEAHMKLPIEVVKHEEMEYFYIRLPYRVEKTGGPLLRSNKMVYFRGVYLVGPYNPETYILTDQSLADAGTVGMGPKLDFDEVGLCIERGDPGKLSTWLIGKEEELPSPTIPTGTILQSVRALAAWTKLTTWEHEVVKAETATRNLGFEGLEIIKFSSWSSWQSRTRPEGSF